MSRQLETAREETSVTVKRVLLVDGNTAERDVVRRDLVAGLGSAARVWVAGSGREAVERLSAEAIDAALVEYVLPDTDGLKLTELILDRWPETAVLMLSGPGSPRVAARAIKLGASDYLVKDDVCPETLAASVREAVREVRGPRAGGRDAKGPGETPPEMDHFVRALSHDMTANFMLLDSSLAELKRSQGPALPTGLRESFAHVDACLRQSKQFLDDLVQLAESGNVPTEPGKVELSRIVEEVRFEQAELIRQRRARVRVAGDLPVAWCNEARAKQVITNLVRNALLHGCDRRQARITITADPPAGFAARAGWAWLRIHDNGAGIPEEHARDIFLPGKRVPGNEAPGSGMGLSIVKKAVEQWGGRIVVESPPGRGTAFALTLPTEAVRPDEGLLNL